jgi:hypothetical protein
MYLSDDKIIEIFYLTDEFCQEFDKSISKHFVINDKGEILNFVITPGNTDDREPLKDKKFIEKLKGKLYADKGYVSSKLTQILFVDGLHLITHIRNNMKNVIMEMKDKILLRKRSVIETINDELKNICNIEHSRHRSFENFITNMIAGLIAYSFFPKKTGNQIRND